MTNEEDEKNYKQATDFKVYNDNNEEVQLSSFKGKPIVINFWTSWCSYCKIEMPYFEELYKKEKANVTFVMINVASDDRIDDAKQYMASQKFTFPVYYDTQRTAAYAYQITGYPVTVFVNKNFEIYKIHQGMIKQELLQKYVNEIK